MLTTAAFAFAGSLKPHALNDFSTRISILLTLSTGRL
jgi:hypothetical protein